MKAQACEKSNQFALQSGKVQKVKHSKEMEKEEINHYLQKLRELVPVKMHGKPKKLEIIQSVIDYICYLQDALEAHPAASHVSKSAEAAAIAAMTGSITTPQNAVLTVTAINGHISNHQRQPLGVLSTPNLLSTAMSSALSEISSSHLTEKTTSESDGHSSS